MNIVEIILISLIVIFQIATTIKIISLIKKYKTIFFNKIEISCRDNAYPLLISSTNNELSKRIINPLNDYFRTNYGAAVNFTIIKDVIDREIDLNDDEISQKLPVPLYLGLAATMVGIICGLFSMSRGEQEITYSISLLIQSVAFAMLASLFGLTLTTILTSFTYKNARSIVSKGKADLLNDIQTNLLPDLNKADDSEINGLKSCLNQFAQQSTRMVYDLQKVGEQTAQTIKVQQETVSKLESMNIKKIASYNATVYEKIESSFDKLDQFSSYLTELNKVASNLVRFSKSIENVEDMIHNIHANSESSKELSRFLTSHFQKLEQYSNEINLTISKEGYHTSELIENFRKQIGETLDKINNQAVSFDTNISRSTDALYIQMTNIAQEGGKRLCEAFAQAAPNLTPLHAMQSNTEQMAACLFELKELLPILESLQKNSDTSNLSKGSIIEQLNNVILSLKKIENTQKNTSPYENNITTQLEETVSLLRSIDKSKALGVQRTNNPNSYSGQPNNYKSTSNEYISDIKSEAKPYQPPIQTPKELFVGFPHKSGLFIEDISEKYDKTKHLFTIKLESSGRAGTISLYPNLEDHSIFFENLEALNILCDTSAIKKKHSRLKELSKGTIEKENNSWKIKRKINIESSGKGNFISKLFGKKND